MTKTGTKTATTMALSLRVIVMTAFGCAPTVANKPVAAAPPLGAPESPMRVEKVREQLQLAPWDLAFSAVRGSGEVTETVTARNLTDTAVTVRALAVLGADAAQFQLRDPPKLPATVPPRGQLSVQVTFAPPAGAPLGVRRALLRFQTGPTEEDGPGTDLSALAILGRAGDDEPSLAEVIEALGYAVDVRRPTGSGATEQGKAQGQVQSQQDDKGRPIGDEIRASLFTRATPTLVALNPVARFSADGPRPFGHYLVKDTAAVPVVLATLAAGQNQTLNPELESGGNASFDPGDASFGLWVKAGKRTIHSEDQRNAGADKHAVRVFPLHARGGAPIPHAFLVAFKDAADDAFQDYVFVVWNVNPVLKTPPEGAPATEAKAPAARSP